MAINKHIRQLLDKCSDAATVPTYPPMLSASNCRQVIIYSSLQLRPPYLPAAEQNTVETLARKLDLPDAVAC